MSIAIVLLISNAATVGAQVPTPIPYGARLPPSPPISVFERNKDLVPALLEAAKDKDTVVQHNVTQALRGLGVDSIPSLIAVLNGKDKDLRTAAAVLLGNMGPQAETAMPSLVRILKNKKEPIELRRAVSRTIALLLGNGPVS
jgi:HEAT repeat protein